MDNSLVQQQILNTMKSPQFNVGPLLLLLLLQSHAVSTRIGSSSTRTNSSVSLQSLMLNALAVTLDLFVEDCPENSSCYNEVLESKSEFTATQTSNLTKQEYLKLLPVDNKLTLLIQYCQNEFDVKIKAADDLSKHLSVGLSEDDISYAVSLGEVGYADTDLPNKVMQFCTHMRKRQWGMLQWNMSTESTGKPLKHYSTLLRGSVEDKQIIQIIFTDVIHYVHNILTNILDNLSTTDVDPNRWKRAVDESDNGNADVNLASNVSSDKHNETRSDVAFNLLIQGIKMLNNVWMFLWSEKSQLPPQKVSHAPSANECQHISSDTICGIDPIQRTRVRRVVGGRISAAGRWPWVAAVYVVRPQTLGQRGDNGGRGQEFSVATCGGALVNEQYVLTTAHCFADGYRDPSTTFIKLGSPDIYDYDVKLDVDIKRVSRLLIHPEFVSATYRNDIALLMLRDAMTFNNRVGPVCLPSPGDLQPRSRRRFTPIMATVVGWGQTSNKTLPRYLHETSIPVLSKPQCAALYRRSGAQVLLAPGMMCAGYSDGRTDACQGDSGGPLMAKSSSGRWLLVGLVSHGYGCSTRYRPGVYTDVTHYRLWILQSMGVH